MTKRKSYDKQYNTLKKQRKAMPAGGLDSWQPRPGRAGQVKPGLGALWPHSEKQRKTIKAMKSEKENNNEKQWKATEI